MSLDLVAFIATVVVGAGTYLMRSIFIVTLADRDFPPRVRLALRFVAPAVMAALVVWLLLGGEASAGWAEIAGLVVGGLVGWKTRSLPWVLVAGMATLWGVTALL